MEPLTDTIARLTAELAVAARGAGFAGLRDDELIQATAGIEDLGRRVDALRVRAAGEIGDRCTPATGSARLSARLGCRSAVELLARLTRASERNATARLKLGGLVRERMSLAGERLPARFAATADALAAGIIGVDSATAITQLLDPIRDRVDLDAWEAAENGLVAAACGYPDTEPAGEDDDTSGEPLESVEASDDDAPGAGVPGAGAMTADQIRIQATVWQAALDPDGVEDRDERAARSRCITRTGTRNGLIWYRMGLLPEISGKLERVFDAHLSPKTPPVFLTDEQRADAETFHDERTTAQKRHDVFAALIDAAGRDPATPSVAGLPATVLVSAKADDLNTGHGVGWIDGIDEPIPMRTIKQFACNGGIQNGFFTSSGDLIALETAQRTFTPPQRRAIAMRDGGCIIPGCTIPAGWCEVHHVIEHADDGPTEVHNGVDLCWWHHRTIDTGGWRIRFQDGIPYIKAPNWIDPYDRWHPANRHLNLRPPPPKTG